MNELGPFRSAPLSVDGQPALLPQRSPLLYISLGVAMVIDVAAFGFLLRIPSSSGGAGLAWGYGIVLLIGIAGVVSNARRYRSERKRLGALVRRSNAAAPEGQLGLFEGVVVEANDGTFLSHVSENPAVFSEVTVQHGVQVKGAISWRTVGTRAASVPFYLDDDTGAPLLVNPNDAPVAVKVAEESTVMNAPLEDVLRDMGLEPEIVSRDAINYRWSERMLSPGERVAVIGRVREKPRRLEIEPGAEITTGGAASLVSMTRALETALFTSLVPFALVAIAVSVIGLLMLK